MKKMAINKLDLIKKQARNLAIEKVRKQLEKDKKYSLLKRLDLLVKNNKI